MSGETKQSGHEGDRIAKVIARAGLASRREAEQWIAAGRVTVNGKPISSPALNVTARDRISVDGQPLPGRERTRLFLYNKLRGLVTTTVDPDGRPTIFGALPKNLPRLVSIGRLDLNTEGLLLLTNDGGLARILELPKTGWLRRYRVRAFGRVTQEALDKLRGGVTIDGMHYGPVEATIDREQGSNVWLTVGIREGKNREVRNLMEHLGLKVNRLIRVSFGPFELGQLEDGAVSEVPTQALREALGEPIIKESEADFDSPLIDDDERAVRSREGNRPQRRAPRDERHDRSDKNDGEARPPRNKPHRRRDRSKGPRPSRPKPSSKQRPEDD